MNHLRWLVLVVYCLNINFIFCHFQSFAVNEPHRLAAGSSRKWEARVSHAKFLRTVSENLHRWPGAKIIKGNCSYFTVVVCLFAWAQTSSCGLFRHQIKKFSWYRIEYWSLVTFAGFCLWTLRMVEYCNGVVSGLWKDSASIQLFCMPSCGFTLLVWLSKWTCSFENK